MDGHGKQIEFTTSTDGRVIVQTEGSVFILEERHRDLLQNLAKLIEQQYPGAWKALGINYKSYEGNEWHYLYLRVCRFILCNMGKSDAMSFDIDNGIIHIEDVQCPIRRECQFNGIVCHPKPLGLTEKEEKVLKMIAQGATMKDVSRILNISTWTVNNIIQRTTKKARLFSAKDIRKVAAAILL